MTAEKAVLLPHRLPRIPTEMRLKVFINTSSDPIPGSEEDRALQGEFRSHAEEPKP